MAQDAVMVSVGSPVTLSINARDTSVRDPDDHRFAETVPVRVVWHRYRGPGEVEFTRHASNPLPEIPQELADTTSRAGRAALAAVARARRAPQSISLTDGHGVASVIATFSEPGEYILRAQADNFGGPDSAGNDQCCWTNGYLRVIGTR